MFPYKNVTYYNIHTFIAKFRTATDTGTPEKRAKELQKIGWDQLDFDDVVIDEAQDFLNDEIIYFKDYAELRGGHFFAFFDKNQLLTTKEVPEWIRNSECKLLLTKNCRNTYEIALTSYNVIDIALDKKVMMIRGEQTVISFVKNTFMNAMTKLLKQLTGDAYGYAYSDIVILSLKAEKDSIMRDVNKLSGIPITRERTNSSVMFTTSSKFKGLESTVVIVIDIDESSFQNEEIKRLFYVACSRATQKLCLIVDGDDQKIKSIADTISKSHFAAKGRVAMKTQAKIIDLF